MSNECPDEFQQQIRVRHYSTRAVAEITEKEAVIEALEKDNEALRLSVVRAAEQLFAKDARIVELDELACAHKALEKANMVLRYTLESTTRQLVEKDTRIAELEKRVAELEAQPLSAEQMRKELALAYCKYTEKARQATGEDEKAEASHLAKLHMEKLEEIIREENLMNRRRSCFCNRNILLDLRPSLYNASMQNYGPQLHALLGDCVDTEIGEPRGIYQAEYLIDVGNPAHTLAEAARDITHEMHHHGFTRVNPVVRPTTRWLDVNCLFA